MPKLLITVRAQFEPLERRALLSVTIDAQGWTRFTHGPQARTVYVSSSIGSDSNSGLSSNKPVRTLNKARSLLRGGMGDWMLLRAGDTWRGENLAGWTKSGQSKDEPLVISSYGGGDRPVLDTGERVGFSTTLKGALRHVAIVGIDFEADTRDPLSPDFVSTRGSYGVDTSAPLEDLLIENCIFHAYAYNISIRSNFGPSSHVGLRRNMILDAYDTSGKSQGLYMSHIDSVLIEDNVFDHNGWSEYVPGAQPTIYGHNIYLDQSNTNVYILGNIIAEAGSHGVQARGGGVIKNNLFLRNPIGLAFGSQNFARKGGIGGDISGNVFLGSADIGDMPRGNALQIANVGAPTTVTDNIFTQDTVRHYTAILIAGGDGDTVGVNNLTLQHNIVYRWQQALSINGDMLPGIAGQNGINGLLIADNDFQRIFSNKIIDLGPEMNKTAERVSNNRYYNGGSSGQWFRKGGATLSFAQWEQKVDKQGKQTKAKYDDPERTIESYNATLGGKPRQGAFLTQARLLSQRKWDRRYTAAGVLDYIFAGFVPKRIPPTVTATNLSSKNTGPTRKEVMFIFDKDVSAKLNVDDLIITNRKTRKRVSATGMTLKYDAATNTAMWTFPKLAGGQLATGDYNVRLMADAVVDARGTEMDGDHDGHAGGDLFMRLKIRAAV